MHFYVDANKEIKIRGGKFKSKKKFLNAYTLLSEP